MKSARRAQGKRSPRLALDVQYALAGERLPRRATIRRWAKAALQRDATVTVRFVGAREARRLNAAFRGKDSPTNVLTFVYDDAIPLAGDVVLCVPVMEREARAQGKPLLRHCAHLLIHGMLHLQGYDHRRRAEATRMEARETALLASLGHPDPYAVIDA